MDSNLLHSQNGSLRPFCVFAQVTRMRTKGQDIGSVVYLRGQMPSMLSGWGTQDCRGVPPYSRL